MVSKCKKFNVGIGIKIVRIKKGLKQYEMAGQLGISQNYLSLLENNKASPSLELLSRIACEYNIPIGELFVEVDNEIRPDVW